MGKGLVFGLMMAAAQPVAAQETDWDRLGERIARAIERAVRSAGIATAEALEALEDADFQIEWDGDWDWEGWDDWDEDAGPQVQEEFRWEGRVDRGDILEIKGVNGPISAIPASGNQVEVVAMKSGRRSDPAEVRIEVIEHAGGVTLCAVYPSRRDSRPNECGVGEDGRNSIRRNDVRVDWEVRVPSGVELRGRTVNGGVEATGLDAYVDLATVNGDVVIDTDGFAEGRTVNGSIEARVAGAMRGDVAFETVNGSIELDLPDDVDAEVDAGWVSGSLETDLPMQIRGRMGRRSASGTLGDGGSLLRLRTVNGSIRIY